MCKKPNHDFEIYKKNILKAVEDNSRAVYDNYSFDHAKFLTALMYDRANKSAAILTGKVADEDCDIASSFKKMVNRGVRVRVIMTGDIPVWLQKLDADKDNLKVKKCGINSATKRHQLILDEKMI